MTLTYIMATTLFGGLASVLLAAGLSAPLLSLIVRHLVSLSTGVLLGTALLHVLPEAFESDVAPQALFLTLLGGLMFFFLLEKAELYRHGHHHEHDHHDHHHGFDAEQAGRGGWSVLVGDSIHNFCDGVLIAAAFLVDTQVGLITAMAIIAHEIPQEVGDYIVLINAGFSRARALVYNLISGMAAGVGGGLGYFLLEPRLHLRDTALQIVWLAVGLGFIALITGSLHGHDHEHGHAHDHEHGHAEVASPSASSAQGQ